MNEKRLKVFDRLEERIGHPAIGRTAEERARDFETARRKREQEICAFLRHTPGAGARQIADALDESLGPIYPALAELERRGQIVNCSPNSNRKWRLVEGADG